MTRSCSTMVAALLLSITTLSTTVAFSSTERHCCYGFQSRHDHMISNSPTHHPSFFKRRRTRIRTTPLLSSSNTNNDNICEADSSDEATTTNQQLDDNNNNTTTNHSSFPVVIPWTMWSLSCPGAVPWTALPAAAAASNRTLSMTILNDPPPPRARISRINTTNFDGAPVPRPFPPHSSSIPWTTKRSITLRWHRRPFRTTNPPNTFDLPGLRNHPTTRSNKNDNEKAA
mmetsp:Transcript_5089/g.14313  ORF Transcript_5089/g.14313 Transcript_5089/m.14313 type:complete len:229 (-) Transcript_5089:1433-2119(-)